jgi:hypothetical protein
MAINVRDKGVKGEQEFFKRFDMFFQDTLKRNLLQTREGGADITGCSPFQIEVKRCEKLEFPKWWRQVSLACGPSDIPVVAFRVNSGPWRFLLPFNLVVPDTEGYMEVEERLFINLVLHVYGPRYSCP